MRKESSLSGLVILSLVLSFVAGATTMFLVICALLGARYQQEQRRKQAQLERQMRIAGALLTRRAEYPPRHEQARTTYSDD